jgi:HAD superfamily phosphoserine phosphatase-like hydrolase
MSILRGLRVEEMREIVAEAWESVLRPLVYREASTSPKRMRSEVSRHYIASARLQEAVEEVSRQLGFAGAIASRAEVSDGVYTGRLERRLYGQAKADALAELARDAALDLPASTAYSDSHSDVPFLKRSATDRGQPDRELRRVASARGWPTLRFRTMAFPRR